jgi:hypothetical protein
MMVLCFGYFGKGETCFSFTLFLKCSYIYNKIYFDFYGSFPNVIYVAYVIVKRPHDKLYIHLLHEICIFV